MSNIECFSISNSSLCSIYSQYNVKSISGIKNVMQFDEFVNSQMLTLLKNTGCSIETTEFLRYLISTSCSLIMEGQASCNNNAPPPLLCNSIISKSFKSIRDRYGAQCIPLAWSNLAKKTSNANCLDADPEEEKRCGKSDHNVWWIGYVTDEELKNYCFRSNFKESCCSSFTPVASGRIQSTPESTPQADDARANYFVGTAAFIFAAVGTTMLAVITTAAAIFFILKHQIAIDKMPKQQARAPAIVDTRTSFYF